MLAIVWVLCRPTKLALAFLHWRQDKKRGMQQQNSLYPCKIVRISRNPRFTYTEQGPQIVKLSSSGYVCLSHKDEVITRKKSSL